MNTPPYYIIMGNGTEATLLNQQATDARTTGNAGKILQDAINSLCSTTGIYTGGGKIVLQGNFNMWGHPLVIKNNYVGRPANTIIIEGVGDTVLLFNGLKPGTHAITITGGANVDFRNLEIAYVQADGGSAIRVEKGGREVAAWKGVFHDLTINGSSLTEYTFYAENFFGFDMQRVTINCTAAGKGSLWLHNNSTTTCYGNSKFQNLALLTPDRNDGAALKISAVDMVKPMNLNSFDVLNIGTNNYAPGQKNGIGILLDGAAATIFNQIAVEYMPISIEAINAKRVIFQSGYIHPDGDSAVGIYCGKGANGCQFNLEVDADSASTVVVKDVGTYKEPNNYDLSLSGSAQQKQISIQQKKDSVVHLRSNGSSEQTNTFATLTAGRLKIPIGNAKPQDGDIWFEGGQLKTRINGSVKTIRFV